MLTKQHHFASRIIDLEKRRAYKTHMCGLCHALGDGYGLPIRLLTSHEMILLNLLTSAQRRDEPAVVMRRCPLNPLVKVRTNHDTASKFAAAASVELASVSVADDIEDSGGRDLAARVLGRVLHKPQQTALKTLESLGFDVEGLTQLGVRQAAAEQDDAQDASQPSAAASAALFAMTARLADAQENADALGIVGANYGAYLYLMDAFRDYPSDMRHGNYNPLRRFGEQVGGTYTLSLEGLKWLLARFEKVQAAIREQIGKLHFYQYQEVIRQLLTEPVDKIVYALWKQTRSQQGLAFAQLGMADALKAAAFVLPTTSSNPPNLRLIQTGTRAQCDWAGQFVAAAPHILPVNVEPEPVEDLTLEGRRKRKRASGDDSSCDWDNCCDASYACAWMPDVSACSRCTSGDGDGCSSCNLGDGCSGAEGCSGCGDGCSGAEGCSGCGDGCSGCSCGN
jgi:hypothetical protein